jgi:multimeric flavodoxin WrbA
MKILGLSCSPRKKANTVILLEQALQGARQEGAETELYSIAGKTIEPCNACGGCRKTAECTIKDDMQELYPKLLEADGIIFGAPVYFYSINAQAKAIIDRTYALNSPARSLMNKVGGAVVTGGSLGLVSALKDLYFFFVIKQMLPANFVAAYSEGEEGVRKREQGMKAAFDLGRQAAQLASKKFQYPPEFRLKAIGFGTHTH